MSTVTILTASVDVDGTTINVQRTGEDVYLLTFEGGYPFSVKGYDNAIAQCDTFAAEIAKLVPVREQVKVATVELEVFAKTKADEFENAKPVDPLDVPAEIIP